MAGKSWSWRNLTGSVVLITGASDGIGRVTALELARAGARVVLLCRDRRKAELALETLRAVEPLIEPELVIADLALQKDVRRAALEFEGRWSRLDVLINNAGTLLSEHVQTEDGVERTFATNHLGHFLLTRLLEPRLLAAELPRVINVASRVHRSAKPELDEISNPPRYDGWRAYCESKLCNVAFTLALARRLPRARVNCLHPGVIASNFGRSSGGVQGAFFRVGRAFLASPEKGAQASLFLAAAEQAADLTGVYVEDDLRVVSPSEISRSLAFQEALWDLSLDLTAA